MDETPEVIEKIDTSKIIRPNTKDILTALIELQVKVNEIIDEINIYLMPDDDEEEDEEDEPTPISPSNITLGGKIKKS